MKQSFSSTVGHYCICWQYIHKSNVFILFTNEGHSFFSSSSSACSPFSFSFLAVSSYWNSGRIITAAEIKSQIVSGVVFSQGSLSGLPHANPQGINSQKSPNTPLAFGKTFLMKDGIMYYFACERSSLFYHVIPQFLSN